jgi:hypothetical protein
VEPEVLPGANVMITIFSDFRQFSQIFTDFRQLSQSLAIFDE